MLNGKKETFEQTTDFKKKGESDASNSAYEGKERKRGREPTVRKLQRRDARKEVQDAEDGRSATRIG